MIPPSATTPNIGEITAAFAVESTVALMPALAAGTDATLVLATGIAALADVTAIASLLYAIWLICPSDKELG
jgi:hypothetical protein